MAKERDVRATIHRALDQLDFGDLALDRSRAPGRGKCRLDGAAIAPETPGEPGERADTRVVQPFR